MPRPKRIAQRPRRDEWESYRRELYRLFIVDRVRVIDIANYMKKKHCFDKK